MKKTTCKLTRFDVGNGFYVEVAPAFNSEETVVYNMFTLCHKRNSSSVFMFAFTEEECPEKEWENIIELNIAPYIYLLLANASEPEDCIVCDGHPLYSRIQMHNKHVSGVLGVCDVTLEFPDINKDIEHYIKDETYKRIMEDAFDLCYKANIIEDGHWMMTKSGYVIEC